MARTEIPVVVLSGGVAVNGASVQINNRGAGAATVYSTQSGGTTVPNPLSSNANGMVGGWVDRGSYDAVITGGTPAVTPYTEPFESTPGADGGIDTNWLANLAVTTPKLADLAVTLGKMAANSVDSSKIVDGSIALGDLAANSIDSSKIVNGTIALADLAYSPVVKSEIGVYLVSGVSSGGWPKSGSISLPVVSNCLVIYWATCYCNTVGMNGTKLTVDGADAARWGDYWFNETSSHKMTGAVNVYPAMAAGSHTFAINLGYVTSGADTGDRGGVAVVAQPV